MSEMTRLGHLSGTSEPDEVVDRPEFLGAESALRTSEASWGTILVVIIVIVGAFVWAANRGWIALPWG